MMIDRKKYQNVLLIGFTNRSGEAALYLLAADAETFFVYDDAPVEKKMELLRKNGIPQKQYVNESSYHEVLRRVDLAVISPGIPRSKAVVRETLALGIETIGEIELAYRYYRGGPIVAVTGTDGKSTVVTLIDAMLKASNVKSMLCGNIGIPLSRVVKDIDKACVCVLELSSFQLESIVHFQPAVSVILNVAEDHMDRYATFTEYVNAKKRIFINQTNGQVLLNHDQECLRGDGSALYFSATSSRGCSVVLDGDNVLMNGRVLANIKKRRLTGGHNLENILAAAAAASMAGANRAGIEQAVALFSGLPHRNEFVRELKGRRFVNNSKGTTVHSVESSLRACDTPVVLIAGGRDKGLDFSLIKPLVKERVRYLVLFGEAKDKIEERLQFAATEKCDTLNRR